MSCFVPTRFVPRRRARPWLLAGLAALTAFEWSPALVPRHAQAQPSANKRLVCDRIVDNFSRSKVGEFPVGWRTKEASEMPVAQAKQMFVVRQDGKRKVLHARYRERAITIGKSMQGWDLDQYPVLQWQWKAIKLPKGGNEDSMSHNDCGASVYTFWDIGFPFYVDSIKYTWSSTLKPGTELKKRLGHDYVHVVQSGTAALGQWRTVQVNLRSDHQRLFAEDKPRPPSGIAVLSDADATESEAEAYYADFRLCRYLP